MHKVGYIAVGVIFIGCADPLDTEQLDEPEEALGEVSEAIHPSELDVAFTGCVESIGVTLIDTAAARAYVPVDLVLAGEGGPVTPLVVRTAHCDGIAVDGSPSRPGSVVQIGAVIVPPDFDADIDNYTFWYATTHARLARHLGELGVDAKIVPGIDADIDLDAGTLHVRVPRPLEARFDLDGTLSPSTAPAGSFVANWWQDGCGGRVKMTTTVPTIAIGGADLVLTTPPHRDLGELLGGGSAGFPVVQQLNLFAGASLHAAAVP